MSRDGVETLLGAVAYLSCGVAFMLWDEGTPWDLSEDLQAEAREGIPDFSDPSTGLPLHTKAMIALLWFIMSLMWPFGLYSKASTWVVDKLSKRKK